MSRHIRTSHAANGMDIYSKPDAFRARLNGCDPPFHHGRPDDRLDRRGCSYLGVKFGDRGAADSAHQQHRGKTDDKAASSLKR